MGWKFWTTTKEKEIKGIQIWEWESTIVTFCKWHDTENPKESTHTHKKQQQQQKPIEIINKYSKVAGYKISVQKSITLLYTNK